MKKFISNCLAIWDCLVAAVIAVFLSGCTLMLGDTVDNQISKLTPSSCPNLSGSYALGGTMVRRSNGKLEKNVGGDILIGYLPTAQSNRVDHIYEKFFNFNRPFQINFRKEKVPTHPKKFDYVLDGNKTRGAYVELKLTDRNEYIVNVYSNSNQLLGTFLTNLLSAKSICHGDKYCIFYQDSSAHMVGDDWAFTTKRSSGEVMFYRSSSGALVRETTGRTKAVVIGVIPTTQPESQTLVTFPLVWHAH